jgi:hypothetical protein
MNAAEILKSWRGTCKPLSQTSAWLSLLYVAEAGPAGILRTKVKQQPGVTENCMSSSSLKKWTAAGLVTVRRIPNPNCGRPSTHITITPKGLRFLRLDPPAVTS